MAQYENEGTTLLSKSIQKWENIKMHLIRPILPEKSDFLTFMAIKLQLQLQFF